MKTLINSFFLFFSFFIVFTLSISLVSAETIYSKPSIYGIQEVDNDFSNGNGDSDVAYAEGYFHNHSNPLVIDLVTENVLVNITNFIASNVNGMTFVDNGVDVDVDGTYQLSGSISFSGGNNGEYGFTMAVNNIPQLDCGAERTAQSTAVGSVSLNCLISLIEDDHLNLQVLDHANPVQDITIEVMNLNIVRIGN